MRGRPTPLSVIRPPPSSTTRWLVLVTSAVARITIVSGLGPQSKVISPPALTAATTAADVHRAGVPLPITCVGCELLTARAAAGTGTLPPGLPMNGGVPEAAPGAAAIISARPQAQEASRATLP